MTDDSRSQIEVFAAVYPDLYEARVMFNDLESLNKEGAIELIDAAVMVRERSGALRIHEKAELTPAKGAKRGALIGAALGVIFPPSLLAGAALGAAAGAITGKVTDQGLSNDLLEELARDLEPGKSAILAVVDHSLYAKTLDAVEGYEKVIARTAWADEVGSIEF